MGINQIYYLCLKQRAEVIFSPFHVFVCMSEGYLIKFLVEFAEIFWRHHLGFKQCMLSFGGDLITNCVKIKKLKNLSPKM